MMSPVEAQTSEKARVQRRILVIDDEAVIGLSAKRTLAPDGHDVTFQDDPQSGLAAALSGDFDVIFVDLMMPGLSGLEILKQLKAAGVASEVVIITGHSTVETAVEAMKQGAADYLSKPFSPEPTAAGPAEGRRALGPDPRERRPAARAGGPPGLRGHHRREPAHGAGLLADRSASRPPTAPC